MSIGHAFFFLGRILLFYKILFVTVLRTFFLKPKRFGGGGGGGEVGCLLLYNPLKAIIRLLLISCNFELIGNVLCVLKVFNVFEKG
jgi:hypothetical protein